MMTEQRTISAHRIRKALEVREGTDSLSGCVLLSNEGNSLKTTSSFFFVSQNWCQELETKSFVDVIAEVHVSNRTDEVSFKVHDEQVPNIEHDVESLMEHAF